MATLLEIAQEVARETGFGTAQLNTVINSNDTEAQKFRALVNRSGRWLANKHPWTQLIVIDHQITTVADQAAYEMPEDFASFVPRAQWDKTNQWRMHGAVQPAEWRYRKDAIDTTTSLRRAFRRSGRTIVIDPTPTQDGDILSVPYVSKHWCQSSEGATQDRWLADDDEPLIDEELLEMDLRWRLLNGRQAYFEEKEEFERALRRKMAQDLEFGTLSMRRDPFFTHNPNLENLPQAGPGVTPTSGGFSSGFSNGFGA